MAPMLVTVTNCGTLLELLNNEAIPFNPPVNILKAPLSKPGNLTKIIVANIPLAPNTSYILPSTPQTSLLTSPIICKTFLIKGPFSSQNDFNQANALCVAGIT